VSRLFANCCYFLNVPRSHFKPGTLALASRIASTLMGGSVARRCNGRLGRDVYGVAVGSWLAELLVRLEIDLSQKSGWEKNGFGY
jgi:hypothetical protein